MPNYKVHDFTTVATSPLVAYPAYETLGFVASVVITASYIIGGTLLSPDLDIPSRIYNRWGFLRWIWKPYQLIIPHRSVFSHSGPISGTIRLLYILLPLFLVFFVLNSLFFGYILLFEYTLFLVWIWIGVVLSDLLHTLLDISPL